MLVSFDYLDGEPTEPESAVPLIRSAQSLLGVDGEVLRLAFEPDVSAREVERHDVASPRDADAVERDQRHRQSLDASHPRIMKKEHCQPGADSCDKISEPQDQVSRAVFRQQRDAESQQSRHEITLPCNLDKDLREKVAGSVPEEERLRHTPGMKYRQRPQPYGFDVRLEAFRHRIDDDGATMPKAMMGASTSG
jgi:hypothetical protein